jgi:hypothetical protein
MHDLYLAVLIGECIDTICILTGIFQQTSIICAQKYEIIKDIFLLLKQSLNKARTIRRLSPFPETGLQI